MPTPTIITLEPILPVQIVAKAFPEVLAGDVNVSVNGTLYDTETAPGAVNIPVTNLNDDSVGVVTPGVGVKVGNSLVIIKKTGGALIESKAVVAEGVAETTIDDSVVVIKDSGGVTLYSKAVKADDVAEQVVNDATVNVRKSDGVLIAAVPVKAQSTEPYNVANSTVTMKDTAGATLDSKSVKATESAEFTAPNATAPIKDSAGVLLKTEVFKSGETRDVGISDSVLTLNSGAFLNVKAQASQNIQLLSSVDDSPIVPASVVGAVIKVAPGGGSFNVGLVDRFGNSFGTKPVTANATWDLRTLTPFDFADIYLNTLSTPPSSLLEGSIIDLVDDLNLSGVFSKMRAMWLLNMGTAVDTALNLKYPFANKEAYQLTHIGSPTYNADGIQYNTTNNHSFTNLPINHIGNSSYQMTIYSQTDSLPAAAATDMGFGGVFTGIYIRDNNTNRSGYQLNGTTNVAGSNTNSEGCYTMNLKSGTGSLVKNGSTTIASGSVSTFDTYEGIATINGRLSGSGGAVFRTGRKYSFSCIGEGLTSGEIADLYTAIQTYHTTLGIQK